MMKKTAKTAKKRAALKKPTETKLRVIEGALSIYREGDHVSVQFSELTADWIISGSFVMDGIIIGSFVKDGVLRLRVKQHPDQHFMVPASMVTRAESEVTNQ